MHTVTVEDLHGLVSNKFCNIGFDREHANVIADVLVYADQREIRSHGIMRLEHYIKRIELGSIKINPEINIEKVNNVICKVNGDQGMGHVVAKIATDEAILLAQQSGIGISIVSNTSHAGAVGYYAQQIANQGMIGIIFTQADALVAPFGGKIPFLGANPIAYGVPTGTDQPIILDMSTSEVAFGKVMIEKELGNSIPLNWGLDNQGQPTDDPAKVHALQPMAGAKGYGLGLLVDILSGILAGETFGRHVKPMYGNLEEPRNLGQFFLVINPEFFVSTSYFMENIQQMIEELHACPPLKSFNKVKVPGEGSFEKSEISKLNGINVPKRLYDFLVEEE